MGFESAVYRMWVASITRNEMDITRRNQGTEQMPRVWQVIIPCKIDLPEMPSKVTKVPFP